MKPLFIHTATEFCSDQNLLETLWLEIEKQYSHKSRHYHSLEHLENMFRWADAYKTHFTDWPAMVFAIFYHDAVYKVLKSDNEEKSAELAGKRLRQMQFPETRIELCQKHILATKTHQLSDLSDTNWLLDIDLSILGADWDSYANYARQVRREYAIYPDLIYNPGRKKVLAKFLDREFIFKTPEFRSRFEAQARNNIQQEIESH